MASEDLEELYQELILDHSKHPRCTGCIQNATCCHSMQNPLCGDKVELFVEIGGNDREQRVENIAFLGKGCSISQASASMMTSLCKGKPISEVSKLCAKFRSMMSGELKSDEVPELGDAAALKGVRKFTARIRCALLAWEVLNRCIERCGTESSKEQVASKEAVL